MRGNPGRLIQVTDGVHKGKTGYYYFKEQTPELQKQKKGLVWQELEAKQTTLFDVPEKELCKQSLVSLQFLKVIGFID